MLPPQLSKPPLFSKKCQLFNPSTARFNYNPTLKLSFESSLKQQNLKILALPTTVKFAKTTTSRASQSLLRSEFFEHQDTSLHSGDMNQLEVVASHFQNDLTLTKLQAK